MLGFVAGVWMIYMLGPNWKFKRGYAIFMVGGGLLWALFLYRWANH